MADKTFLRKNKESGFTLIETFVAIVVLMVAVLGPMALLSKALQDSRYIKDEITATFLAQEGVELMIDNRNNGDNFKNNDYSCSPLKLDSRLGYNCLSGDDTAFTRLISIDSLDLEGVQYRITSNVSYKNNLNLLSKKSVVSSSIIFR